MNFYPLGIGWKSTEITLYACLVKSVEFGGHNLNGFTPKSTGIYLNGFTPNSTGIYLNGFTPNLTSRIGWKFTELTLYACLVELGIISVNSTGIYLNGFTPNSTGH